MCKCARAAFETNENKTWLNALATQFLLFCNCNCHHDNSDYKDCAYIPVRQLYQGMLFQNKQINKQTSKRS